VTDIPLWQAHLTFCVQRKEGYTSVTLGFIFKLHDLAFLAAASIPLLRYMCIAGFLLLCYLGLAGCVLLALL
jgi:hypothetical protein